MVTSAIIDGLSDTYEKPTNIENILPGADPYIDVYTIMGVRIRTQVLKTEATQGLSLPEFILLENKKYSLQSEIIK